MTNMNASYRLLKETVVMPFSLEVLDDLFKDCKTPEQMFGSDRLLQQRTKALIERSVSASNQRASQLVI